MAAPEVPGYQVLEEIGRGGFAVVYRARQSAVDRIVALKVLGRLDLDGASLLRFEQECRAMGALSWHPHIVVIYDAGTTSDGTPYLAMEHLPGGSLAERLATEGPLRPDQVATIGAHLASALTAAHEIGVLHRDIKPENVLIDRIGHAKLADFGIASVQGTTRTATGIVSGTLTHLAPEILEGQRASVATDVYALGSTLFTLAAGRPAFSEATDENQVAILRRVLDDPVPDLRPLGVPDALARAIERAMAKDPADRYPTPAALAADLHAAAAPAAPPGPPPRPPDPTLDRSTADWPSPPETSGPEAPATAVVARPGRQPIGPSTLPPLPVPPPSHRRHGLLAAAVAVTVAVIAGGVILAGRVRAPETALASSTSSGVDHTGETTAPPPTSASSRPPIGADAETDPKSTPARVVAAVGRFDSPSGIASGFGSIWVSDWEGDWVGRIDPAGHEITSTIPVGEAPDELAVGAGSVWVVNFTDDTVSRIDPESDTVEATIAVGGWLSGMTYGDGSLWVGGREPPAIYRIDPATNQVSDTIALAAGSETGELAYAGDMVWATDNARNSVIQIDPSTNTGIGRTSVPAEPWGLSVQGTSMWVASWADNTVSHLDISDVPVVDATVPVGEGPEAVALDGDVLWVTSSVAGSLSRLDPETGDVTDTLPFGDTRGLVVRDGDLWLTDVNEHQVVVVQG